MNESTQDPSLLQSVSDTAWLVAALRATETERPNSLIRDPFAKQLVGTKGPALVSRMSRGFDLSWFMAVRTYIIDDIITRLVNAGEIECIANLACGLDARGYRMELPKKLLWIDIDLPGVIEYRSTILSSGRATCHVESRSVDLADDAARRVALKDIASRNLKTLVLTEGLLPYLSESNVAGLADDILSHENFRFWLTDFYGSSNWSAMDEETKTQFEKANASLKFSPMNGVGFFADHGWRPIERRSFVAEGERLNRHPPKYDMDSKLGQSMNNMWSESEIVLLKR